MMIYTGKYFPNKREKVHTFNQKLLMLNSNYYAKVNER